MQREFIRREAELAALQGYLDAVRSAGTGVMVSVRGRRQVGKSRLMEEFLQRSGARAVFFAAAQRHGEGELARFTDQLAAASVPGAEIARAGRLGSWEAALAIAASGATRDDPIVIVLDEFPYLVESVPGIEGTMQALWDRTLEPLPVLVLVVGSDVAMMEQLSAYNRPLYGRMREMVVRPLSPAAINDLLGLSAGDALDAYLVIGGFPRLAATWAGAGDVWAFLARELADPESPLIVFGERSLSAEFPADAKARDVLETIGAGERAFTSIQTRSGVSRGTLDTTLAMLAGKRVITRAVPYSTEPRKLPRYWVADPHLRFFLQFLLPNQVAIERGRSDLVVDLIRAGWQSYAGRAVEPLIREAIERTLPDDRFGDARVVGGFWTRDNSIEVDLVGGPDETGRGGVSFVGSIKWRAGQPLVRADLARLIEQRAAVPGADNATTLVGVSRSGFDTSGLDVALGPDDIIRAFA